MIRSLYNLFISFSLSSYVFEMSSLTYLLTFGLKTLTSKNVIWPVYQKALAQISKRTLFPVRVYDWRVSLISCCNWGSIRISLHASFNSLAVIFWICLCYIEMKPPFLHERASSRSNLGPEYQLVSYLSGAHLYLIRIGSQNSGFLKL